MREEPEKYLPGGGLNPFWIDWDMENNDSDNEVYSNKCCDMNDNITIYENNNYSIMTYKEKLEAAFRFLKEHSTSEEDFKLAKQILGIDTD